MMKKLSSFGFLILPLASLWGAFEMFKEATKEVNDVSDFGTISGTLNGAGSVLEGIASDTRQLGSIFK